MTDGWQDAEIVSVTVQTPGVKTFVLRPSCETRFEPGQHVDVRLTASDGYTAVRGYSVSSSPLEARTFELCIERLGDGEVSPYFHDVAAVGDVVEVRGPFTRHFVWRPLRDGATLLVGGGSGIAPLMAMVRYRASLANVPPLVLVYSARSWQDVIFREELLRHEATQRGVRVVFVLTRDIAGASTDRADGSARVADYSRRVDAAMLGDVIDAMPAGANACFVCGNNAFVGTVADALVAVGVPAEAIRTERYGE